MAFATGEDVMRTVESLVSDLAIWLNANFSAARDGQDVYLAPKQSLVRLARRRQPPPSTTPNHSAEYNRWKGSCRPFSSRGSAVSPYIVPGGHDEVRN
jgi:hypothetical protein